MDRHKRAISVEPRHGRIQWWPNYNTSQSPILAVPSFIQVGNIGAKVDFDVGDGATPVVVDWNRDGKHDLLVGARDGRLHLLLSEPTAEIPDFRTDILLEVGGVPITVASGWSSAAVGDLNRDGLPDLIVGNGEGQLLFYPNTGTPELPQFMSSWRLPSAGNTVGTGPLQRTQPIMADYNDER